jgi:hypothetical protein
LSQVFAKTGVSRRSELAFLARGLQLDAHSRQNRDPAYRRDLRLVEILREASPRLALGD